jgi:hypothetical protein
MPAAILKKQVPKQTEIPTVQAPEPEKKAVGPNQESSASVFPPIQPEAQNNQAANPLIQKIAPGKEEPVVSEDTIQKKKTIKCDETFAEYLNDVAKVLNKGCYKQTLKFVFLFRECLNHYGDRLNKSKQTQGVVPPQQENKNPEGEDYCLINNAEQAPEVSNEFVTVYLEERKVSFEKFDVIELTQNFCNWLYSNGYTCSKLSLIQENPQ